jgi:hypothetical protein
MTDEKDKPSGSSLPAVQGSKGLPAPQDLSFLNNLSPEQRALFQILNRQLDVANRQIDIEQGKLEIALKSLQAGDAEDQRQFDFHTQRVRLEDGRQTRRSIFTHRLFGGLVIVGVLFVSFLAGMAFFGNAAQAGLATSLLEKVITFIAGGGTYAAARAAYDRLHQE